MYYLQSRYYSPEWGRFINADDTSILQLAQGQLISANMLAYANNNPIMNSDPSGYISALSALPLQAQIGIIIFAAVNGGLFNLVYYLAYTPRGKWSIENAVYAFLKGMLNGTVLGLLAIGKIQIIDVLIGVAIGIESYVKDLISSHKSFSIKDGSNYVIKKASSYSVSSKFARYAGSLAKSGKVQTLIEEVISELF